MTKEKFSNRYFIILLVLIALQISVIICWGGRKEGYFTDEEFSYDGARSGGESMVYWSEEEDFIDHYHTRGEFIDRITIRDEDRLLNRPKDFLYALTHRNLYYTILNAASSIWQFEDIWWTGICLNIVFFVLAQILFYKISGIITGSPVCSLMLTGIYGFSAGAISMVLYSRCYLIMSFCLLLAFFLLMRFSMTEKIISQIVLLIGSLLAGGVAWRFHQLGFTTYLAMLFCVLIYLIITRDRLRLRTYLIVYGVIGAIGVRLLFSYVSFYYNSNIGDIFRSRFMILSAFGLYNNGMVALSQVGDHLCGILWILFVIAGISFICMIRLKTDDRKLFFIPIAVVLIHFTFICIGGALAWRYYSPVYPFIVLGFFSPIAMYAESHKKAMVSFAAGAILITTIEYARCTVSDLYIGTDAQRDFFQENYPNMDGYLIIHDHAGENYNYEAAWLWPESTKVYFTHLSTFEEDKAYIPDDDRILLWLNIDYKMEPVLDHFLEVSRYDQAEEVFKTEHLTVYECR